MKVYEFSGWISLSESIDSFDRGSSFVCILPPGKPLFFSNRFWLLLSQELGFSKEIVVEGVAGFVEGVEEGVEGVEGEEEVVKGVELYF